MPHPSPRRRPRFRMVRLTRRLRAAIVVLAALPVFQTTGCFPDPIGALNFELQSLVNSTLIGAVATIVENIFRL